MVTVNVGALGFAPEVQCTVTLGVGDGQGARGVVAGGGQVAVLVPLHPPALPFAL
jgi:hypothetical protein